MNIIEFISQPWHWSISGALIVLVMFLLIYLGKQFGISTSFDTLCTIAGAGKKYAFFDIDLKDGMWRLIFAGGSIIGGLIASTLLASPEPVAISAGAMEHLSNIGVNTPQTLAEGAGFIPSELFTFENLLTLSGFLLMVVGGFFIGFGTRYAGGCTSGHAISGLSELQIPSLIAVIGFFIGGLVSTYFLLPFILSL
jgi:uncharacterized protein